MISETSSGLISLGTSKLKDKDGENNIKPMMIKNKK